MGRKLYLRYLCGISEKSFVVRLRFDIEKGRWDGICRRGGTGDGKKIIRTPSQNFNLPH